MPNCISVTSSLLPKLRCDSATILKPNQTSAWPPSHLATAISTVPAGTDVLVALSQDPVIGAEALEFPRVWVALGTLRQTAAHAWVFSGKVVWLQTVSCDSNDANSLVTVLDHTIASGMLVGSCEVFHAGYNKGPGS